MPTTKMKSLLARAVQGAVVALAAVCGTAAHAAAPGIAGTNFDLTAKAAYITQPDGRSIYSWGYGCNSQAGITAAPATIPLPASGCPAMQLPGPTLVVQQGTQISVTLTNNLPTAAGNTSILFPGMTVAASGADSKPGLLTQEAPNGKSVTYTFTPTNPGTYSYYSGTQGDLQIEMGLYGAIIVVPRAVPANCTASAGSGVGTLNDQAKVNNGEADYRHAAAAYGHPATCYDREYLFQFSEMDPKIHTAAEAIAKCVSGVGVVCPTSMNTVETEPYHPAYFLINGRSMPDIMDTNYASQYPHQPYNGNPHMHPGELTLVRIIGHGRWQHPFHEHGNHVRVLARDGNLLLAPAAVGTESQKRLAGPLLFTTTTTPGQTMDAIFYWTGKGLNWDVFGHDSSGAAAVYSLPAPQPGDPPFVTTLYNKYNNQPVRCVPDANGYYTSAPDAPNFYEWCGDHNKALEANPFGSVAAGGPVTLPDPNILTNGAWYGGSPYFGPDAMVRAVGSTPIPPFGTVGNSPTSEAGFAYMWHSHNEREITTNNIFPGGMFMMMLVDPRAFQIDESK